MVEKREVKRNGSFVYNKLLYILFLFVIMLSACQKDDELAQSAALSDVKVGDTVPDFILEGIQGDIKSSSLSGQIYMLTFFDTGCPDCRNELPVLQQIYDKYKDVVPMFLVPRSQSIGEVDAYWKQEELTLPTYTAPGLYYKFAQRTIPRTYVVDGEGVVRAVYLDSPVADFQSIDSLLSQLLEENESDEDNANVTFRLKVPVTRAGDDSFSTNEYVISHFELFLFDATTKKFVTKAVLENLEPYNDYYDAQYDITYLVKSLKINVGKYNIFAIANYDHCPDIIPDQDEFLNMVDTITYAEGILANIPNKGPVMTSRASALQGVDLVPFAGKDVTLTLEMERVLAKVQIGVSKEFFELWHGDTKYADINITNYKFVNLLNRYYLFQHTDKMAALTEKPEFQVPDNFTVDCEQGDCYVVDPLFYQKKPNSVDVHKMGNYFVSWFGNYNTKDFASIAAANNYGTAYILENTCFKDSQKDGYTTGVVLKASVSPVFAYLYDVETYTLKKENRAEYWPDVIYFYNYNFYGSLQAINVASGLSFDVLETYTESQLKQYGIKMCKFNMGVYETYYTYWIRHRIESTDPMGPMKYGIVRNNFYKITVTGVSGIGNSEIVPDVMRDNYPNSYVDVEVY